MKFFRPKFYLNCFVLLGLMMGTQASHAGDVDWKAKLKEELPQMGHRNWIAVVDSAYPLQVSPGVETIVTGSDQLEVLKAVLDLLGKTKHVRPVVFTDLEMTKVAEPDAPGIGAYRDALTKVLGAREVKCFLHEKIIGQLDEAGEKYHVIILKTNLKLPYTSVFLRLDCGYWNPDAELRLRAAMGSEAK